MDLFHVLCCSGSMCVGVTVWFCWGGVVSLCRLKHSSASARTMKKYSLLPKACNAPLDEKQ